jgi:hypothetical protein
VSKYVPWFIANGSVHLETVVRLDVDRMNNAFHITVRISRNKKNELVEDIIRVEHLGQCSIEMLVAAADKGCTEHRMFRCSATGSGADKQISDYEAAREIRIRTALQRDAQCRS